MEVRLYLLLTVYVSNKIVTWQEVVKWNVYRELLFLFFNSYFSSFFFPPFLLGRRIIWEGKSPGDEVTFSRRSRAVTGTKCTKKRDARAKLLFC